MDDDYIRGRIVSIAEHGVFMESVEEGTEGQMFGSTWEGLIVHPDRERGELLTA